MEHTFCSFEHLSQMQETLFNISPLHLTQVLLVARIKSLAHEGQFIKPQSNINFLAYYQGDDDEYLYPLYP